MLFCLIIFTDLNLTWKVTYIKNQNLLTEREREREREREEEEKTTIYTVP